MCELLIGLPAVIVLGIVDEADGPLWVQIETRGQRPVCTGCGGAVVIKDRPVVALVDLPAFGRPARLVWRKHRWRCPDGTCPIASWTEEALRIASARLVMTDRAGRWVTEQVGRWGRTVNGSPSSWAVTGTPSTTRCSPLAPHSLTMTPIASGP